MNIGILTVRGPDYHPNRRLLEAAKSRGHRAKLIHPYRSWPVLVGNVPVFCGEPVSVDLLVPRQGAEIGESSLALIEQAQQTGIPVVNGPAAIRLAASKYRASRALAAAGIPVPDAVLVNTPDAVAAAGAAVGGFPAVVKPVSGRQGEGVFLAADADSLFRYLAAAGDLKQGVVVQRFIAPAGRRDIRILVLGRQIAGASALRPAEGDFRSNFHLTGSAEAVEPAAAIGSLAVSAVRALGLQIGGVDLVIDDRGRPWVMEVNYSPGFRGLEAATGIDIAGAMVEYLERLGPR
jgi:ribosomal protein S6--L-glutamate ligase